MSFKKKWCPSASQKKAFAEKMRNDEFRVAYLERKKAKEEKRRASSVYDYPSCGGSFVPTRRQYEAAYELIGLDISHDVEQACNMVIYGFTCNERVDHDFIHVINEFIRSK